MLTFLSFLTVAVNHHLLVILHHLVVILFVVQGICQVLSAFEALCHCFTPHLWIIFIMKRLLLIIVLLRLVEIHGLRILYIAKVLHGGHSSVFVWKFTYRVLWLLAQQLLVVRPALHILEGWSIGVRIGDGLKGDRIVLERVRINLGRVKATKGLMRGRLITSIRRSCHQVAESIHHALVIWMYLVAL